MAYHFVSLLLTQKHAQPPREVSSITTSVNLPVAERFALVARMTVILVHVPILLVVLLDGSVRRRVIVLWGLETMRRTSVVKHLPDPGRLLLHLHLRSSVRGKIVVRLIIEHRKLGRGFKAADFGLGTMLVVVLVLVGLVRRAITVLVPIELRGRAPSVVVRTSAAVTPVVLVVSLSTAVPILVEV